MSLNIYIQFLATLPLPLSTIPVHLVASPGYPADKKNPDGKLRLLTRTILLDHTVIGTHNLSIFF